MLRQSLRGFFRSASLQGTERLPASGPVLFVANHTNAFIDPLLVLTNLDRQVTLTAKRTLAGNPLLAPLIKALGVILFDRASDGLDPERVSRNQRAIERCVERLTDGGAVLVFPEGVSHSDPAMRDFRTGAARIVAAYLEREAMEELWIVPVGLHFTKKDRWRSDAVALIGEPVGARAWSGGSVDARALTGAMRSWVEALTVNSASPEERELLATAEELFSYRPEGPPALDRRHDADAELRIRLLHRLQRGAHALHAKAPTTFDALAGGARTTQQELRSLGVGADEVGLPMRFGRAALFVVRELEVLVVGAPLALAGAVLHMAPFAVTRRLVRTLSEDEDHPASNAVLLSIPIFVLWWIALAAVAFLALSPAWSVFTALAVPFTGLVNLHYRDRAGGVLRRVRTFLLWRRQPELQARLAEQIQQWQNQVRAIEADLLAPSPPSQDQP